MVPVGGHSNQYQHSPMLAIQPAHAPANSVWGQINIDKSCSPAQRSFPKMREQPLVNPGYQEAHLLYNEMRQFYATLAYSSSNTELVVVRARMATMLEGKRSPTPVSVRFLSSQPI
jgi:hypothetical protein